MTAKEQKAKDAEAAKAEAEQKKQEAAAAKAEGEKQQKEQAAADEAKRKALEAELAHKNAQIKKQIDEVNAAVEQGKSKAASGSLRSALASFEAASSALPEGEKAFAAQKYTEMGEALYSIAQNSTDSTVKNEALASALEYANMAVASDPTLAAARFLRARIATDQKKAPEALADYKEAARLDPKNYLYLYELGKAQYLQKQYADAKQSFTSYYKAETGFRAGFL